VYLPSDLSTALWEPGLHTCQVKALLLYFLSGLRKGLHQLGYRNLPELHDGLEREMLRMERLGSPNSIQQKNPVQKNCGLVGCWAV